MIRAALALSTLLAATATTTAATTAAATPPDALPFEGGCGTSFSPAEGMAYLDRLRTRAPSSRPALGGPYFIPVAAHIVRQDDGTGGLPLERLDQAIVDANGHYAAADMVFFLAGPVDFIDSDAFYSTSTLDEIDDLRTTNLVPGALNIYFTENLDYESGGLCGISAFSFSSVQSIAMRNSCTANPAGLGNHSTFSHEIGHFFDLFHTHEPFYGEELVDGSNCDVAGDLVCDTPADPRLGSGNVTTGCVYVGTETDPAGMPYEPDPSQLMSYSLKHCRDDFSPESLERVLDTLLAERDSLLGAPVDAPARGGADGPRIALAAPRPNPTGGATAVRWELPRPAAVDVAVFDVRGARVRTLAREVRTAGAHEATWDGRDAQGREAAPGIYFVRLAALGESVTRKVQRVR